MKMNGCVWTVARKSKEVWPAILNKSIKLYAQKEVTIAMDGPGGCGYTPSHPGCEISAIYVSHFWIYFSFSSLNAFPRL